MKILLILKKNASLTGAGTYEAILHRELAKRHRVKVYEGPEDLAGDCRMIKVSNLHS